MKDARSGVSVGMLVGTAEYSTYTFVLYMQGMRLPAQTVHLSASSSSHLGPLRSCLAVPSSAQILRLLLYISNRFNYGPGILGL
jgi:hypothetical protein